MGDMELQRMCFGPEDLRRLKLEAVGGRPYAERISISLAILLLSMRERRGDYYAVVDEIDFLEGLRTVSKTKASERFNKDPLLQWLWHKHFSSARHIAQNIGLRWGLSRGGNQALDTALTRVAQELSDDPASWRRALDYELVVGGYEARVGRLTGEWILYSVHKGKNLYLSLGTHEEGKDPKALLQKLRGQCAAEWPFLFEDLNS